MTEPIEFQSSLFVAILASLCGVLMVSEGWLRTISRHRAENLPCGFERKLSSFLADLHLTLSLGAGFLLCACVLIVLHPEIERHRPYLLWTGWVAAWTVFSIRRWQSFMQAGYEGLVGDVGPTGKRGATGAPGDTGPTGRRGATGAPGDQGPVGHR